MFEMTKGFTLSVVLTQINCAQRGNDIPKNYRHVERVETSHE